MAKGKRRAFRKEFKAQTVRLVRDSGKSVGFPRGRPPQRHTRGEHHVGVAQLTWSTR